MLVVSCSRVSRASRWSSRAIAEVVSGDMKCRATAFSVLTRGNNPLQGQGGGQTPQTRFKGLCNGRQRGVLAVTKNQRDHRKQKPGLMASTATPAYLRGMWSRTPCSLLRCVRCCCQKVVRLTPVSPVMELVLWKVGYGRLLSVLTKS